MHRLNLLLQSNPRRRKEKVDVDFDDRSGWSDLQVRLFDRTKEIIKTNDAAELSNR
eukprot:UN13053